MIDFIASVFALLIILWLILIPITWIVGSIGAIASNKKMTVKSSGEIVYSNTSKTTDYVQEPKKSYRYIVRKK